MSIKTKLELLDALMRKWEQVNEEADKYKLEHGKDTTYYIMVGQSNGLLAVIEMVQDLSGFGKFE